MIDDLAGGVIEAEKNVTTDPSNQERRLRQTASGRRSAFSA
jgi:hypothetical protein